MAAAKRYEKLGLRISGLQKQLNTTNKVVAQEDQLAKLVSNSLRISASTWNLFLAVILALTIELITSIGPYHAFRFRSLPTEGTEEPQTNSDPGLFIARHAKKTKGGRVTAKTLYDQYLQFCAVQGFKPLTSTAFGRWMTNAGYRRIKSGGVNVYTDLVLYEVSL
jgi:hypothetical protein